MEELITLTHPVLGDRNFDPDHARRIMAFPNNGGWEWKNKSDSKVDLKDAEKVDNGTGKNRNSKNTKGADKQKKDPASNQSGEQA